MSTIQVFRSAMWSVGFLTERVGCMVMADDAGAALKKVAAIFPDEKVASVVPVGAQGISETVLA